MSFPPLPFKVRTKVSWAGEEEGDLGFMENEVIDVYSIVDDSWLSGRLRRNKNEGIFPKDYVQVLEDNSRPTSQQNTPKHTPIHTPLQTPVKDFDYDHRARSNKYSSPVHGFHSSNAAPQKHLEDDNEFTFDSSMDADRHGRSSEYSKKSRHKLKSKYVQDERQREIERFRLLQQQHVYQIKGVDTSPGQSKRAAMQAPYSKSKASYGSPYGKDAASNRQSSSPNLGATAYHDVSLVNGSPSYNRSVKQHGGIAHAHTVETLAPETSPRHQSRIINGLPGPNDASVSYLDEISAKKRQLELELLQLEELQKSTFQMKRASMSPISPTRLKGKVHDSTNSSYISEDLISSKKNYSSRDDLGRKLAQLSTEDDLHVYGIDDSSGSRSGSPPPPPPKHNSPMKSVEATQNPVELGNIPYDADDFGFSGNSKTRYNVTEQEMLMLSQLPPEELKSSLKSLQSDVLNLSELSATSAGSFLRHKYEREYHMEEMRMKHLSLNKEPAQTEFNGTNEINTKNLMDSIFQDKSSSKQTSIFKKLLKRKDDDINPLEQKMQEEEQVDWVTFKMELNRMNTLTSQDKQARTRRVVRKSGSIIVKPFDYITEINTNETVSDDIEPLKLIAGYFNNVDAFASRYDHNTDLNEIITDISVKYNSSTINRIRAVLIHFAGFRVIEETGKISQTKPKLNELLHKGEGSIFQLVYLFKKVLDAMRIPSEVVLGFWKKPNEFYHDEQYIINHCWLSVLVEDQFRMVDLLNFKNGELCNVRNKSGFNEFYFLTEPMNLITTHIPSVIDLQHIIPPIDQNIAFYLPRLYSGYYTCNLKVKHFNNALTRLQDLEFFETDIEVPVDVELFALVKTSKITTNEYSLCQIYWSNNRRYAKVKAILPEKEYIGVLQVFAGPKGSQKHFDNIHELAVVIPIYHQGISKPCKFVPRYPTVQSQNNDLYVKHPQTSKIIVKNSYNFEIMQHPSMGVTPSANILNQDFKMVIESPSGKYFKLVKDEPNKPFSAYVCMIKCQELGVYRGLVIGDSGNSWYVFAQWECVTGTVTN